MKLLGKLIIDIPNDSGELKNIEVQMHFGG